jgi:hypothetical protein
MADYHSLLAKAVAGLPNKTSPQARSAIYERARKALLGQLRSIQPPLAAADIEREERALNEAIERVDRDYANAPPEGAAPAPSSAPPTGAPTASPPAAAPKPLVPAPKPFARPAAAGKAAQTMKSDTAPNAVPPPDAAATPELKPPSPPFVAPRPAAPPYARSAAAVAPTVSPVEAGAGAPPAAVASIAPAARRPFIGSGTMTASSATTRPTVVPAPARVAAAPHVSAAPPTDAGSGAPPPVVSAPEPGAAAPTIRANGDRPAAPSLAEPARRGPWLFVVAAVAIIIVIVIAAVAFLHKETPPELAVKEPSADSTAKPDAPAGKIAERVTGAAPEGVTTDSPIPTVPVPVAPVHAGDATPAPIPAPTAQNAQTAAPAAQAPAAQPPAVSAPGRAALLVEVPGEGQKPRVALGTAVWSFIPAPQVGGPSLRVEVEIPDVKMHASVTIRKNSDASLPATHTIDVRVAFGEGSEFTGFKDMGLPQMRKDDTPSGDTLAGVRVKINDNYFLVGLTRSDTDAVRNLDLIATRNWFDFPILMNNDRVAKLTIEKGADGIAAVNKALEAWK